MRSIDEVQSSAHRASPHERLGTSLSALPGTGPHTPGQVGVHLVVDDVVVRGQLHRALEGDDRFRVVEDRPGQNVHAASPVGARCVVADGVGIAPWLHLQTQRTALVALVRPGPTPAWAVRADRVLDPRDLTTDDVRRTLWDAAQSRRLARALDHDVENRQLAFDATTCGIALISSDLLTYGTFVEVNAAMATFFGLTVPGLRGRALGEFVMDDEDQWRFDDVLAGRSAGAEGIRRIRTAQGDEVYAHATAVPAATPEGEIRGVVLSIARVETDARTVDEPRPTAAGPAAASGGLLVGDLVSPGVAARTLGVSSSTVRRWIDDGRLEACRTPGGHRRVSRAQLRQVADAALTPRLQRSALPDRPLPGLARLLGEHGADLVAAAARLTYEPGFPGWFAEAVSRSVVESWATKAGRSLAAGLVDDAVVATGAMFREAREFAGMEECQILSEKFSALVLRDLQRTTGGAAETVDGRAVLAAMRRSLAVIDDARQAGIVQ